MAIDLRSVVENSLQHCQASLTVKGNKFQILELSRLQEIRTALPSGAASTDDHMWLKPDLLVGNSGALDIFCLIKRSKTRACMRTLFVFAHNCGYLRDSTGFLRANCGLARRRKSTNFTYTRVVSTTSVAQSTVLEQTADPCKPRQYLRAWSY